MSASVDVSRGQHRANPCNNITPADYDRWLDPAIQKADLLQPLFRPFAADALTALPISTRVNNPKNEGPKCIEVLA